MDLFCFFDLRQTPMLSLAIFFLNHNKYAHDNKSIKYHFTRHKYHKPETILKITLGGGPLCVIVSCQCNLGVREVVNPLVGSIGEELETITS